MSILVFHFSFLFFIYTETIHSLLKNLYSTNLFTPKIIKIRLYHSLKKGDLCKFIFFCKDFEYQPNVDIWYEFEHKSHKYYPDFCIGMQLIELKGDQFLKEDGSWQNPYDHLKDALYEAKHQCCIQNNVKILGTADYQQFLDYVSAAYGSAYLNQFKR